MTHSVDLELDRERVSLLYPLLRRGFWIRVEAGAPLRTVLTRDLGFCEKDGLEEIQTVLVDGAPVDELDTPLPAGASTLALSAAMPGLLGACLRRDGAYAGLRSSITHIANASGSRDETQEVRIKLYNLLAERWGRDFLSRGIRVEAGELAALVGQRLPELRRAVREARVDGAPLALDDLVVWLGQRGDAEMIDLRS